MYIYIYYLNICKYSTILAPCGCFLCQRLEIDQRPSSDYLTRTTEVWTVPFLFRCGDWWNLWYQLCCCSTQGFEGLFMFVPWWLQFVQTLMAINGVCTPFLDKVLFFSSRTWWVTNLAKPRIDSTSITIPKEGHEKTDGKSQCTWTKPWGQSLNK